MTFNKKDFLDWAQNAQSNPVLNQYQDYAKEFKHNTTSSEIAAINNILDGGKNIIGTDRNTFRDANRQVEESITSMSDKGVISISNKKGNIHHPRQRVVGGKTPYIGRGKDSGTVVTNIPPKYADSKTPIRTLKPTPGKALEPKDDSPLLKTRDGEVRPSDIRNKAREKRIKKIAKRKTPMGTGKSLVSKIFGKK